jgi:hypothetical protein
MATGPFAPWWQLLGIDAGCRPIERRGALAGEDAWDRAHRQAPLAMARLRNLADGALRLAGHPNLATALPPTGRDPVRPLAILGLAHRRNGHHATLTEPWVTGQVFGVAG